METWKSVVGYEGRYEVSDLGRLKSLAFRSNGGEVIMTSTRNYSGYHVVTLGSSRKQKRLHVLVLEAFVGPRPRGTHGCHNDSNKDHNWLLNLRWDTPKGNIADRRSYKGENHPNSKLSDEDVALICERRSKGEKLMVIANDFGITDVRVSQLYKKSITEAKL
jgi:hypothetical protein